MAGINKVMIIGNVGKDPELTYTPSGAPVCTFSVATSESWKDKNTGQKRENTEWHNIVVWNQLAEHCAKYLSKGRQVYIEGKLQTRSWEKDGITFYRTEIVAKDVKFLGGSGQSSGNKQYGQSNNGRQQHNEDDIPF